MCALVACGGKSKDPEDIPGDDEPTEVDPNTIPSDELFQCDGPIESSPARIRRIDNEEWAASIGREGTDARLNPLTGNPNHKFSSYAAGETLDAVTLDRFIDFAPESTAGWRGPSDCSCAPKPEGVSCIYEEGMPDESCVRHYVHSYLRDFVLFREASEDEIAHLTDFSVDALARAMDSGQERVFAIEQIHSAVWMSTAAMFRSEQGRGDAVSESVTMLSDEEYGKLLAYALTDRGPGAPGPSSNLRVGAATLVDIRDAIRDGSITERATVERLVAQHFGGVDEERNAYASEYWVSAKVARFFREWLDMGGFRTSFHDDPQATSGLGDFAGATCEDDDQCPTGWECKQEACRPFVNGSFGNQKSGFYGNELTLDQQLDEMIARILVEDEDVIAKLFTSRMYFIPSSVTGGQKNTSAPQFVYNVTEPIPNEREARWWEAPEGERAGVLSHPAWLAAHGDNFENGTSAVHRGLWVRRNLLCGVVPDVPITVDAAFSDDTIELSARERLDIATGDDYCQGCHSLMNPLGLPFEIYNHAGFLREEDHGASPDGSSTLVSTGDAELDVAVRDAVDMSQRFSESEAVEQCVIRQTFRFFAGRNETREDACALVAMQESYRESGGSFRAMLITLLTSPAIMTRHVSEEEL